MENNNNNTPQDNTEGMLPIRDCLGELIDMIDACNEQDKKDWVEYAIKLLKELSPDS